MSDLAGEERAHTNETTQPKNVHPRKKFTASIPFTCFLFQPINVGIKYRAIAAIMIIESSIGLYLIMD